MATGGSAQYLLRLASQATRSKEAFQSSAKLVGAGNRSLPTSLSGSIVARRDLDRLGTTFPSRRLGAARDYRGEPSALSHFAAKLDSQFTQVKVESTSGGVGRRRGTGCDRRR